MNTPDDIRQRIERSRSRHSLADVARRTGIIVETSNRAPLVRCPLPSHGHPDRTPSMRLYLEEGNYFCFGCRAKGDVIQWVRDAESLGLSEAIRVLDSGRSIANAWAGVAPSRDSRGASHVTGNGDANPQAEFPDLARTSPERVRAALRAAWRYYTYGPLHARGASYLDSRGLDITVLERHTGRTEVGHTPARPDGLVAALRGQGFHDDELVDAGLAHRRLGGDQVSDFYRQRVLIPLRDAGDDICGFIGRNVGDTRWAKYKNPPRTAIYDKSINLYRPLPAPVDSHGQVVVVEGTLDALAAAIAAVRAGVSSRFCPVTQSGRELSDMQLRAIVALHQAAPVLGFDGDAAGADSAFRYSLAFAAHGKAVMVTVLDEGHDPASWLAAHGPRGLAAWARHYGSWTGPAPIAAATFLGSHLVGQSVSCTAAMEALVDAANVAGRLPRREATAWVQRLATVAGTMAVAEAHEHEGSAARERMDVFLERIAGWGRRFPRSGDSGFIRSATDATTTTGMLPGGSARLHLQRAMREVVPSVDDGPENYPVTPEHLVES